MSGLELFNDNTEIKITYGDRTVLTTEGTLINLLPPSYDISYTFNITFPDIIKGYWYWWRHAFSWTSLGSTVAYDSSCLTTLTACPQEFEEVTNIVSVPSGADFFSGKIRFSRTVSPSHTWDGSVIQPLQPISVDIPLIGSSSFLMESVFGFSRACSIYISDGQLKLNREQSVSVPPGGWNFYGNAFSSLSPSSGSGGENVHGGTAGIPILQFALNNVPSYEISNPNFTAPAYDERTRRGYTGTGANVCPIPNPSDYNYGSTYQAILTGSFGRRS